MTSTVRRTFCEGPYGQIHCRVATAQKPANRKPTLVCLHMSPKSSRSFADAMPYLSKERHVLAPDFPGHGESDPPPAQPQVTIDDFARSSWAAIDATDDSPVHLLGYHTGSMVAVAAALSRPSRVLSLTLVSAPIFDADETASLEQYFAPIPMDEAGTRFSVQWQKAIEHRGAGISLQQLAVSFAENLRGGEAYEWGHRAAFAYAGKFATLLPQVQQPVFVMNPADSCFEATRRCDALLQNGKRTDYEHWGQEMFMAYPEEVATEVLRFIEVNDPSTISEKA